MLDVGTDRWQVTGAQSGIWYAQQLEPENPVYNTGEYVEIEGQLNLTYFERALKQTIIDAESLHMQFGEDQGGLWQTKRQDITVELPIFDLRGEEAPVNAALDWMKDDISKSIDLNEDLLFRNALFQLEENRYFWYQKIHHIAADAYGFSLITQRTAQQYTLLMQGEEMADESFRSIKDVIEEDQAYRESDQYDTDREFWMDRFVDTPEVVSLGKRSTELPKGTITLSNQLPEEAFVGLKQRAKNYKFSWHEVIAASMALYLHRMTQAKDVILSVPMMNRIGSASLKVPSMVMNLVPLRLSVQPGMSFRELVHQVKKEVQAVRSHQKYRHEELRRDLNMVGVQQRLFGPQLNIMPFDYTLSFGEAAGRTHKLATGPVDDLSLNLYDRIGGSGLHFDLDANPSVYSDAEVGDHLERLVALVETLASSEFDRPIGSLDLLLPEERVQVLETYNHTNKKRQQESMGSWFDRKAGEVPEQEAVVHQGQSLTYEALQDKVDALAHVLHSRGIGRGQFVALVLPRSESMVAAMLAIMKTGAAYLPIDPEFPQERIAYMLEDADPSLILTADSEFDSLADVNVPSLMMDDPAFLKEWDSYLHTPYPAQKINLDDPVYTIYTSGSTGKPKGVVVSHCGLLNFLESMEEEIPLQSYDRLLAVTTIAFDISVLELWLPLVQGATVILADKSTVRSTDELARLIETEQVTVMQATPTLWQMLMSYQPASVEGLHVLTGGEPLPVTLMTELENHSRRITNLYGPTETTIWSTMLTFDGEEGTPSIGRPIANTEVYVLDHNLKPLPPGVEGDLYIAGDGLALGYHGQEGLTAERFIANPFCEKGTRMYRTGDIVCWNSCGMLEYKNRADHQVKVRGFRIEPGEIESFLTKQPGIDQTAVLVREDEVGSKKIVAYFSADFPIEVRELRALSREYLPDYMVPSAFVQVEEWPKTPNGKLDRKALPAPDHSSAATVKEPRTPQEEILCDLFSEVLGLHRIGMDDSFFDLGGHSLTAGRLMNRIKDVFEVEIGIGKLFESPTVEGLAQHLKEGKAVRPPVRRIEEKGEIPLSFAQKRLWFLHRLEGPSPTYNIPVVIRLDGKVDKQILQEALGDLVERHQPLRTIFPEKDGASEQVILDTERGRPDLSIIPMDEAGVEEALKTDVRYAFDLAKEPSFKVNLYDLGGDSYVLLLLLHHIVGDGWSIHPMIKDLEQSYKTRLQGENPRLEELSVQYADYALWQEQLLDGEGEAGGLVSEQLTYWKEKLSNLPEQLEWTTDYTRPLESSYQGETITFPVEKRLLDQLKATARESGTSLFMVLQAGLSSLMTRLGAGDDIPLGSPVAGRSDESLGNIVGLFINTLVLRTDTSGDPTFRELLGRVRKVNIEAYENQDLPFERLVEVMNPARSRSKHPLFQVMLALQNTEDPRLDLPGVDADIEIQSVGSSKFDLTFEFKEEMGAEGHPSGLKGLVEFSTDLFERKTVENMIGRLLRFLEGAVADPDQSIGAIDILTPEEKGGMLEEWSGPSEQVERECLTATLERQVEKTPHHTAVVCGNDSISYESFNQKANQVAHRLIGKGVGPGDFVALALPRSIEMMVNLVGILKAGAAYVPLDPNYPKARLEYMLNDSEPACIITDQDVYDSMVGWNTKEIIISDEQQAKGVLERQPIENPTDAERKAPLTPDHPAYIIYTSGSTGNPKGVVIPHQNVTRLFGATDHWFRFGPSDVWTLFHSYAFDFSVWEMWGPLLHGGKLVVVPHHISRSPKDFLQLLVEEQVTVLNQTPSAFYQLMQSDRETPEVGAALSLRYVIFGGEALDINRLDDWYERHAEDSPHLINMYGITETTVHVSYIRLNKGMSELYANSVIGENIPDLGVYILDEYLQPVPVGVTGEMYVAGDGLALGYLGRPDLTADRFIANPFDNQGARMYRTGDLARFTKDGMLDYIGRADHQVKVRGFRIELGEIEGVLAKHEYIHQCAVIVREDQPGDKRLIAYFVSETDVDVQDLRSHLLTKLPDYMVPSAFVGVEELPLTANGKLNKEALPAPDLTVSMSGRAPRNPQEELLCDLFMEVLDLPRVGIDDGFFDLGGHSLLAVQLMSKVKEALGVELTIGMLFESSTVAGLAEKLDRGGSGTALDVLLPLRKNGEKPPLFCVHPAGGLSWCYAGLMKALGEEYPIYGLQARGIAEKGELPSSIDRMAADYIQHMKTVQPEGPYYLLGWSLGGNVIHAMATQLERQGEEVALVAMLDAYPSHFLPIKEAPDDEEALIALLALGGYDPDSLGDKKLDFENAKELLRSDGSALASLDDETIRNLKETYVNSVGILGEYDPAPYEGDLLFFRSTIIPDWFTPIHTDSWHPYIHGEIEQYEIECRHKDMCQPQPIAEIGEILLRKLNVLSNGQ